MHPPLHDAAIPVFTRYLARLAGLVSSARSFVDEHALPASQLLEARLAPDMLPFRTQVEIAANFALRACFPLAGKAVPPYGEFPANFDGLLARIARANNLVASLDPQDFDGRETQELQDKAGDHVVTLPGHVFLHLYALPNFFFHVSMAYAILRSAGVRLGKADYDGFHAYPSNK